MCAIPRWSTWSVRWRPRAHRVEVHDPWVDPADAKHGIRLIDHPQPTSYDAIVVAVAHDTFRDLGAERIRALGRPGAVIFDVKQLLPADAVDERL